MPIEWERLLTVLAILFELLGDDDLEGIEAFLMNRTQIQSA
jgi:hypothetical protein